MGVLRNSAGECAISSECDNGICSMKMFINKCYITSYNRFLSNVNFVEFKTAPRVRMLNYLNKVKLTIYLIC